MCVHQEAEGLIWRLCGPRKDRISGQTPLVHAESIGGVRYSVQSVYTLFVQCEITRPWRSRDAPVPGMIRTARRVVKSTRRAAGERNPSAIFLNSLKVLAPRHCSRTSYGVERLGDLCLIRRWCPSSVRLSLRRFGGHGARFRLIFI